MKENKLKDELDEQKAENQIAINKLNGSFLLNKKMKEYVSNLGNVLNKAQPFDNNLAVHLISAAKIILVLVDVTSKMEELLNNVRSLFNGLGPEPT